MAGNKGRPIQKPKSTFFLIFVAFKLTYHTKEYNNIDNNLLNMQWDDYSVKFALLIIILYYEA